MKSSSAIVLLLIAVMLLAACGHTAAPAPTPVPTAEPSQEPTPEPASVPTPSEEGVNPVIAVDLPADIPVADGNGRIVGDDAVNETVRRTVSFGRFYQDAAGNELSPIEWIVLTEKDGYTLLLTDPIIASLGWVTSGRDDITWAESDLRRWLDQDFFETAFTPEEQAAIAIFDVTQPQNPRYDTPAGEATQDRVTLLSYQELVSLMPTELERKTKPTPFAAAQGCYLNPDGDSAWWLRSPGPTATVPEHLASWGNLGARTHYIDDNSIGVRPVIWVRTDAISG